ncbi:uncharacterized protein K444DRAFT_53669 [Hyaloscypha bicolor E]|uniref:Transcription factor domain-containing protein n=1 Tax=Hyaloscypha bicolor E TaxID=1095630 RepID=A0A2J6T303_9HELO|nr:uncharacterized protein K444DRAFT_53669 [Hyaloscypha bicolor E]PMD57414.1 hypothetical protein K444DRAFT_53669 [Hyaloscypha bicolor E]
MTYSYLRSERGWSNPELALGLKMAAISQINLKLSHPSTATCTNVIASIAYLCTGTWIFGSHFEEVETHLDGLGIMVKQRGMESLGVYQFGRTIRKYIFVQHLLLAAIRAQPPTSTFDLDYNRLFNSASVKDTKHVSPLYCPQETFAQLLQSKQFSEDTVDILYNAKALIDLVIDVDEGTIKEVDFNITLFHIKNELERHISADDPQGIPDCNWVFECCRLTVAIMLKAMETSQPLLSSSSALTHSLVSALEKTDIGGNWGELSGVLYWVSMIGSASSQGRPGHRVLDSALGRTMSEIAFTASDFGSAVEPVRKFSRLQLALKRRSQVAVPENSHRKY